MLLVATFSVVALESSTAQNDLVAASFPAVAACLLLGPSRLEPVLGGVAAGLGLGVKLTTALVVPFLAWLALARGRMAFAAAAAGGVAGFVAIGMWGYVLNAVESGRPARRRARARCRAAPRRPTRTASRRPSTSLYALLDLSVLSNRRDLRAGGRGRRGRGGRRRLAAFGGARTGGRRSAKLSASAPRSSRRCSCSAPRPWSRSSPASGASRSPAPEGSPRPWRFRPLERIANANYSAFGPVGIVALFAATVSRSSPTSERRADSRHLALACAFPGLRARHRARRSPGIRSCALPRSSPPSLTAPLARPPVPRPGDDGGLRRRCGPPRRARRSRHDQGKPFDPASRRSPGA